MIKIKPYVLVLEKESVNYWSNSSTSLADNNTTWQICHLADVKSQNLVKRGKHEFDQITSNAMQVLCYTINQYQHSSRKVKPLTRNLSYSTMSAMGHTEKSQYNCVPHHKCAWQSHKAWRKLHRTAYNWGTRNSFLPIVLLNLIKLIVKFHKRQHKKPTENYILHLTSKSKFFSRQ